MNPRRMIRATLRLSWPWRLGVFATLILGMGILHQAWQVWLGPSWSTEYALQQMQPNEEAASALRFMTFGNSIASTLMCAAGLLAGVLLFLPWPHSWRRWLHEF